MSLLSEYSNAQDIRRAIASKALSYVPEWRFSQDDPDGGTALALAFGDMFGETAERLARIPHKYFLYFLNMLETKMRYISPATGLAQFILTDNALNGRRIPSGTQLYADVQSGESESTRVVFETDNEITAVPSSITDTYGVDPRRDVINKLDIKGGNARLFYADTENDLQAHRFSIWHGDVLNIKSPARITVRLESASARHSGGRNTEKLADSEFAQWSFVRDGVSEPFTNVHVKDGLLMLELEGNRPAAEASDAITEMEKQAHIVCDMRPGRQEKGVTTDGIMLGSAYLSSQRGGDGITPDMVYHNDIALKSQNPGYLLGREPARYDTLLISCEEVMSKRGARVNLEMVMHTIIREIGAAPDGPVYNWDGRYVIDRAEGSTVTPDNIYVSDIVWEYWNDVGWAHLETEGSVNPFKSDENIRRESISFICPEDMAASYQNSVWGFWIRARVTGVENPYSQYGLWQLPFAESLSFEYDYGPGIKQAHTLMVENNADSALFGPNEQSLGLSLYRPFRYPEHAVYLAFDKQPNGYPVSIYFGLDGPGERSRTLSFERLSRDASGEAEFRACKVIDGTDGLKDSGVVYLYVPADVDKERIFGVEAYWLRVVDVDLRYDDSENATFVSGVELNAAEIVQRQTVQGAFYNTELFESGKTINLPNSPVLDCEVLVDELGAIEPDKLGDTPGITLEYDADGGVSRAWVKWNVLSDLRDARPDERGVSLDMRSGVLQFGNGVNGRVPPSGTRNIRVNYSYGGGTLGNLPVGAISGLVSSIPTVMSVTNFTPTGGGSDRENIHALQRVGPARLRHRGRAVTLDDYENLILTEFPEITAVKAFLGFDSKGEKAPSFVTVVLLPKETENRDQVLKICKNAYQFLAQRAHCELVAAGRLSVVPALLMTVNAIIEAVAEDITRAAVTERMIIEAVSARLSGGSFPAIGYLPSAADIFDCLRGIPNLSYVDRVLLEGQYYESGKRMLTALDKPDGFPFASALGGTHIVRF